METLSFIGSGNVATHLALAFYAKGYTIAEIYSRTPSHAECLALKVGAKSLTDIKDLEKADIYIIAVEDKAIASIVEAMPPTTALVLHTAGSVDMNVLRKFANHGVFYPLQSLHRERYIDISAVPFLIEANTTANLTRIAGLAGNLSVPVRNVSSEQRRKLHLSAVFSCNFVNALLASARDIAGDDFSLLAPLVRNTIEKAFQAEHPKEVQTGPALRGDLPTMNKHLNMLKDQPKLQEAYNLLSKIIMNNEYTSPQPPPKEGEYSLPFGRGGVNNNQQKNDLQK
ncbi:MAG: DUF2520 domain-containing protein [Prevotellaceae bacterium]|nr:DUF2520 domain-containing protein [Prevotellaceae bacterium]